MLPWASHIKWLRVSSEAAGQGEGYIFLYPLTQDLDIFGLDFKHIFNEHGNVLRKLTALQRFQPAEVVVFMTAVPRTVVENQPLCALMERPTPHAVRTGPSICKAEAFARPRSRQLHIAGRRSPNHGEIPHHGTVLCHRDQTWIAIKKDLMDLDTLYTLWP